MTYSDFGYDLKRHLLRGAKILFHGKIISGIFT